MAIEIHVVRTDAGFLELVARVFSEFGFSACGRCLPRITSMIVSYELK